MPRLLYFDKLRIAVVVLVILHHAAVIYGANTSFYYVEPHDALTTLVLVIFQLLNQAWFMGAFFFLAGYFSPGSFDRKKIGSFLTSRLLRLGIPMLVFMFVISPLAAIYGINAMPASLTRLTTPLTWSDYPHLVGIGPFWFSIMLFVFDFAYAGWRTISKNRIALPACGFKLPGYLKTGIFILALALVSYLVRIPWPLGTYVISFPSLAYLPQYLGYFCLGILVYRGNWLPTLPSKVGI